MNNQAVYDAYVVAISDYEYRQIIDKQLKQLFPSEYQQYRQQLTEQIIAKEPSRSEFTTISDGLVSLDIACFIRQFSDVFNSKKRGRFSGRYFWTSNGQPLGGIHLVLTWLSGQLEIRLNYHANGQPKTQHIVGSKSKRHFGGYQYYFRCPNCGNRRHLLQYKNGSFKCKVCVANE